MTSKTARQRYTHDMQSVLPASSSCNSTTNPCLQTNGALSGSLVCRMTVCPDWKAHECMLKVTGSNCHNPSRYLQPSTVVTRNCGVITAGQRVQRAGAGQCTCRDAQTRSCTGRALGKHPPVSSCSCCMPHAPAGAIGASRWHHNACTDEP